MPEQPTSILLDEVEKAHFAQIPARIARRIELAVDGTALIVAVAGDSPALQKVLLASPTFTKALLALKAARLLRWASVGLSAGHYEGSPVLLRSAFEAVAYFALFEADEKQIYPWLRAELHTGLTPSERAQARADVFDRAKRAFSSRSTDVERDARLVRFLWDETSKNIHASIKRLAEAHGLVYTDLLPDDIWHAGHAVGNDMDAALNLLSMPGIAARPQPPLDEAPDARQSLEVALHGRFNGEELALYASMVLYVVHKLLDMARDTFPPVGQVEIEVDGWHKRLRSDH